MATAIDYEIWIPSRKRSDIIGHALELLPTANVFVEAAEVEEYAKVVPATQLVVHCKAKGIAEVRKMMLEACQAECLVMVDDDLRYVASMTGKRPRRHEDPAAILQIIENGITVASDLGVPMFCWNRNANPLQFFASEPFGLVGPAAGAWGIIGRKYAPNPRLSGYEDVDMTMQCLLEDRLVLYDRRFYWHFGRVWQGKGGNQGLRTSESEERDRGFVERKWGKYVMIRESKNPVRRQSESFGMSIRVRRRSGLATTR